MKRPAGTIALFALTVCLVPVLNAQDVWERIPPDPDVVGITGLSHITVDPGGTLWAFRDERAYRSEDRGATFSEYLDIQFRRPPGEIISTTFTEGGVMYAGTAGTGVHALESEYWQPYNSPGNGIRAVAFTGAGGLIAGTGGGIYALGPVVIGEGWTWVRLLQSGAIYDMSVLPDGTILAASEDGIYRSADDGQTWTLVYAHSSRPAVYGLASTSDGVVLATGTITCPFFSGTGAYDGGVYRSEDDGETWSVAISGLTTPFGACIVPISDIIVTPQDEAILAMEYAEGMGMEAGIYLSTDGGSSWTAHNTGLQTGDVPRQFTMYEDGTVLLYSHASRSYPIYIRRATATARERREMPEAIHLAPAYPNPFNPSTTISFTLDAPHHVRLAVYNVLGEKVATLSDEMKAAGRHEIPFVSDDLPSGTYLYRLEAAGRVQARTMTLLR